jgi:hypothetical protein
MDYYYYINSAGKKDGPHDLVSMMRRIRAGKILPETMVCREGSELAPAYSAEYLSSFFNNPVEDIRHELSASHQVPILKTFSKGWHFTMDHQGMAVFAGGILLVSWLFGVLMHETLHATGSGAIGSWMMFVFLQSCFFSIALRVYRGQKTDLNFLEHTFAPILGKLAFVSVFFSFLVLATLPLLIIPGVITMLILIYIPMFILDFDSDVSKTISSIISLLRRLDKSALLRLASLILFYMVCIALIIPIPIIMPIIAGGLCSIYEDLAAS